MLHFPIFPVKTGFFRFDLGKFDLGIPDIPHIPEIFDLGKFDLGIPDIPEIFDLGKFDLGIPDIPEIFDLGKFDLGIPDIPEIFDLGIFAHFFLVVVSAHFVPIPPFPILLTLTKPDSRERRKSSLGSQQTQLAEPVSKQRNESVVIFRRSTFSTVKVKIVAD